MQKAETIVEIELESFWRWFAGLSWCRQSKTSAPISNGCAKSNSGGIAVGWPACPTGERAHIEALSRGIVNKILHQILSELHRNNGVVEGIYAADVARRLLGSDVLAD